MSQLDFHSKAIGWLKIVLPLAALALLSTLFLVARTVNPEDAIPFAEVDVADRIKEPRMTDASFATVTNDGGSLTFQAIEVRPDEQSGSGSAKLVTGSLELPSGSVTDLQAAAANYDSERRQIHLTGDVEIETSTGWSLRSETLTALMDETVIYSDDPVVATGPAGSVNADRMRIEQSHETPEKYVLVFNGNVKLVYTPEP